MGIPETILAAGIGGAATVTAALFQLYTTLKVKTKADARPKKANMLRSSFAIAALMIASAAGGYLFAELRQQQVIDDARATRDELRGMRDEMNAQLQALALAAEHLARERGAVTEPAADSESLVLARGAVDRACEDLSGDRPAACETTPVQATPTASPVAADGDF